MRAGPPFRGRTVRGFTAGGRPGVLAGDELVDIAPNLRPLTPPAMRTALRLALVLLVLMWLAPHVFRAGEKFITTALDTGTAIIEAAFPIADRSVEPLP